MAHVSESANTMQYKSQQNNSLKDYIMKKNTSIRHLGHGLIFLAMMLLAVAAVMLLWNYLIPAITGWATINYWQALGLMVLGRLVTGNLWGKTRSKMHQERHDEFHKRFHGMSKDQKREHIRQFMSKKHEAEEDTN